MAVEALCRTDAQIVHVTPSHQFPTGAVLSAGRREALLQWAQEEEGRYILEDDYDSEFRFLGRPVPALQGMARRKRWCIFILSPRAWRPRCESDIWCCRRI